MSKVILFLLLKVWLIDTAFSQTEREDVLIRQLFQQSQDTLIYGYEEGLERLEKAHQLLSETNDDSLKATVCQSYGALVWAHSDYTKARILLRQAMGHAKDRDDINARSLNTLGLSYYYTSDYDTAIIYLNQSLEIQRNRQDSAAISRVCNNLGLVHRAIGNFEKSNEYLVEGIRHKVRYMGLADLHYASSTSDVGFQKNRWLSNELYQQNRRVIENSKDPAQRSRAFQKVGTLFQFYDETDSSIHYLKKAYEINDSLGYQPRLALDCIDLGNAYLNKGDTAIAVEFIHQAIGILKDESMYPTLGSAYLKLGTIAQAQGKYEQAFRYHEANHVLSDTLGHRASVAKSHLAIARIYRSLGNDQEAIERASLGLALAEKISSFEWIKESHGLLSELFESEGAFERSLFHQKAYRKALAKEKDAENNLNALKFEAEYELGKKQEELVRLSLENKVISEESSKRQTVLLAFAVAFLVTAAIVVLVFFQYRRIKSLNKEVSKNARQKEMLLKEIHHRVKNNLQMISSMMAMQMRRITGEEDKDILKVTQSRVMSISLIHDHLYKNSQYEEINLKFFLKDLVSMIINSYSFKEYPKVNFRLEEILGSVDASVSVGLIVHELVNNAFKYAFEGIISPKIDIECKMQGTSLSLIVSDNGVGNPDMVKGFGWSIIDACLENESGHYSICQENGFSVAVNLPDFK